MPTVISPALAAPVTTALSPTGSGVRYDVGPGHPHTELSTVPWFGLGPGDVVNIHYRPTPYVGKFGVRAIGTATDRVVINGVTNAAGDRPRINGEGAQTAAGAANVFTAVPAYGELLGVIVVKKGPDNIDPYATYWPGFIDIQNLEVYGARNGAAWTDKFGGAQTYSDSAGIYILHGHDIRIINCKVYDNAFGIFVQEAKDTTPNWHCEDITVRGCHVYGNGVVGSYYQHNLYIQAIRPIIEGNLIGQTRTGSEGSSYKSRSAGEIFRYNTVIASDRACDFVHAEGQSGVIDTHASYGETWAYGNLIINDFFTYGRGAGYPVHFGCDQSMEDGPATSPLITDADLAPGQQGPGTGVQRYAKRNLFFFNNTYIIRANQVQIDRVSLFDLSLSGTPLSPRQRLFEWDNAYHLEGTANFAWLQFAGELNFKGGSKLYSPSALAAAESTASAARYALVGTAPAAAGPLGFTSAPTDDFTPAAGGAIDNTGVATPSGLPGVWVSQPVTSMPNGTGGAGLVPRSTVADVGAFESGTPAQTTNNAPTIVTYLANVSAAAGSTISHTVPAGSFGDPDGDTLTWSATGLPAGLSFTPATRTFSGTIAAPGVYVVTVTVTDPSGASAADTVEFTITQAQPQGAGMFIIQKGDLAQASFSNNNTNAAGGIAIRTDASSTVGQAIAAAIAALPPEKYVTAGSYNTATDALTLTLSDNVVVNIPLNGLIQDTLAGVPTATDTLAGKVALAVAANYPQVTNDVDAATPAYVQAAIAAIPPAAGTPAATDTLQGKVALAVAANYPQATNDVDAATPAYVQAALAALDCTAIVDALNQTPDACADASRGAMLFTSSAAPDILSGDGNATLANPWTVGNLTFGGGGMQAPAPTPDGELRQLLQVATRVGPQVNSWLTAWAANPVDMMVGNITYNANGAITTAGVVWPDGATGVYTATTLSTTFPGATDEYTVTYVGIGAQQGVNQTVTQPLVTRDAAGRIITRPARTVAVFNPAAGG